MPRSETDGVAEDPEKGACKLPEPTRRRPVTYLAARVMAIVAIVPTRSSTRPTSQRTDLTASFRNTQT